MTNFRELSFPKAQQVNILWIEDQVIEKVYNSDNVINK